MARLCTTLRTQDLTLPRVGSYRAVLRHSDMNASCTISSATGRRPHMR